MKTSLREVFAAHDEGKAAVVTARDWVARFQAEYDASEDALLRAMAYETRDDDMSREDFIAKAKGELDKLAVLRNDARAVYADLTDALRTFEHNNALTLIAGGR